MQRNVFARVRLGQVLRFALILLLVPLFTGCASFSNHMDAYSSRSGAPPYPDDPEANGNPRKSLV